MGHQVAGEDEPRRVWQVHVSDGPGDAFLYFSNDAGGVRRLGNAATLAFPRLGLDAPVALLLPTPVGIETRWRSREREELWATGWGGPTDLLVLPPRNPNGKHVEVELRGELVDPSARVTVPAGEFTAAHAVLTRVRDGAAVDGAASGGDERLWFARGTGIVRRELDDGVRRVTAELVAFEPGEPEVDAAALQQALVAAGLADARSALMPPIGFLPRSTFLITPRADDPERQFRLWRVCGATVQAFDPEDAAHWRRWFDDEYWLPKPAPADWTSNNRSLLWPAFLAWLVPMTMLAEEGRSCLPRSVGASLNPLVAEASGRRADDATAVARRVALEMDRQLLRITSVERRP